MFFRPNISQGSLPGFSSDLPTRSGVEEADDPFTGKKSQEQSLKLKKRNASSHLNFVHISLCNQSRPTRIDVSSIFMLSHVSGCWGLILSSDISSVMKQLILRATVRAT
jgi:hypothetical protein